MEADTLSKAATDSITVSFWVDHAIQLLIAIITAAASIRIVQLNRFYQKKDKKWHDVGKTVQSNTKLKEFCKQIQKYTEADRTNIWLFHNGGYYYTGEPQQHLSMKAEANSEGTEDIIAKFQGQQIELYQRNLEKLIDSNYIFEYNELQYKDSLAAINALYHISSSALFKISNKDGYMVAILAVSWEQNKNITEKEIEYIKMLIPAITLELMSHKKE